MSVLQATISSSNTHSGSIMSDDVVCMRYYGAVSDMAIIRIY